MYLLGSDPTTIYGVDSKNEAPIFKSKNDLEAGGAVIGGEST